MNPTPVALLAGLLKRRSRPLVLRTMVGRLVLGRLLEAQGAGVVVHPGLLLLWLALSGLALESVPPLSCTLAGTLTGVMLLATQ